MNRGFEGFAVLVVGFPSAELGRVVRRRSVRVKCSCVASLAADSAADLLIEVALMVDTSWFEVDLVCGVCVV